MNCREARADIALYAGGDLDDRDRVRELRRHVGECPDCRTHYHGLKSSLKLLGGLAPLESGAATWQSAGSLWPAIRKELARPPEALTAAQVFKQLRNWTPFAAMTAACLVLLVALGRNGSPREQPVTNRGLTRPPIALQTPPSEPRPRPEHSESESARRHSGDRGTF